MPPLPSDEPTRHGGPGEPIGTSGAVPLGTVIGRYVVLKLIGRGGMGEVYAAYDPDLDRRVAVKLLSQRAAGRPGTEQARLLREAKALARLDHHNVIAVHDAGAFAGLVFLAMELVEGITLREWMNRGRHVWRDCLRLFADAGRGLAAAHDAGLVHRDFKPENVMLTAAGQPKVMDFGLARPVDETAGTIPPGLVASTVADIVTTEGVLIGTPAYMSPEQLAGAATDARSDQFSFCVALFEALYGERPFPGGSASALADNIRRGTRVDVRSTQVPGGLRRIVLRGLDPSPAKRFPRMGALIDELDSLIARGRQRRTVVAVLTVAGLAAVATTLVSRQAPITCSDGATKLASIWELPATGPDVNTRSARKEQIRAAFMKAGGDGATPTFERAATALNAYVRRWSAGYRDACEATQVRGEQSHAMLDLRMGCLQQRREGIESLTDLMASADAQTVSRAVEAVYALEPVELCADGASLRSKVKAVPAGVDRGNLARAFSLLSRAKALFDTGKWDLAVALALEAKALPTVGSYCPIVSQALLQIGTAHSEKGNQEAADKALPEAFWAAEACRHDEVAAKAALYATTLYASWLHRPEMSNLWENASRAAVERMEHPGILRAWFHGAASHALQTQGRLGEALVEARQMLASAEKERSQLDVAIATTEVGLTLDYLGRFDEAAPFHDRAVALGVGTLGPENPRTWTFRQNQAENLNATGRSAEARPLIQQTLRAFERMYGPEHPFTAYPMTTLGNALLATGNGSMAVEYLEQALRIRMRSEPVPMRVATTQFALAQALDGTGRDRKRARKLAEAAWQTYRGLPEFAESAEIERWLRARVVTR